MTDASTRHTRGLLVVILLGLIFLALLALIILKTGGEARSHLALSERLTVLPVRIRLRTEPNARAPVVATATSGETLRLLEDQGAWVRVENTDGLSGWAERANLERTAERQRRLARYTAIRRLPSLAGVTTTRTQLFAGPGIFYPLVGEIPAGTSVKVFTRDHDFYAIDFEDHVAYADVDTVDVTASGAPQLDVATSPTPPPPTETIAGAEPPEEIAPPPPEPALEPERPALVSPGGLTDQTGVWAAVPPGGTQPEEIDRVIPRYPNAARRAGVSGAVVIRGIVRRDGRIDNVEIIKDLPHGLGESARDAVSRWRFRPATYRGEPIDVYYTVTVNFRLQ
ncbi:MAG TPA: TonB family protein [Thermoanaerobaculia bacterium]|nr:TonB family protein [Thermoanaerobaculia bacterium]